MWNTIIGWLWLLVCAIEGEEPEEKGRGPPMNYDAWLLSGPGGPNDDRDEPIDCPVCGGEGEVEEAGGFVPCPLCVGEQLVTREQAAVYADCGGDERWDDE